MKPTIFRALSKIQKSPDGCWIWTDRPSTSGYGLFRLGVDWPGDGRVVGAHRFVYELHKGSVPKGKELDHLCRVTMCVNPDHLEPVTHRTNMRRGVISQTTPSVQLSRSECINGHPYTFENTQASFFGDRQCVACLRARQRVQLDQRAEKRRMRRIEREAKFPPTHCKRGHLKTPGNTWTWVDPKSGKPRPRCRECLDVNQRNYTARKKAGK